MSENETRAVGEVVPPILGAGEIEALRQRGWVPEVFASHEALRARVEELTAERDAAAECLLDWQTEENMARAWAADCENRAEAAERSNTELRDALGEAIVWLLSLETSPGAARARDAFTDRARALLGVPSTPEPDSHAEAWPEGGDDPEYVGPEPERCPRCGSDKHNVSRSPCQPMAPDDPWHGHVPSTLPDPAEEPAP